MAPHKCKQDNEIKKLNFKYKVFISFMALFFLTSAGSVARSEVAISRAAKQNTKQAVLEEKIDWIIKLLEEDRGHR